MNNTTSRGVIPEKESRRVLAEPRFAKFIHALTHDPDPSHGRLMKGWLALDARPTLRLDLAKEAKGFVTGGES